MNTDSSSTAFTLCPAVETAR